MKIAICGSIVFSEQMGEIAKKLEEKEHEVYLPLYTTKMLKGEIDHQESLKEKEEMGDEKLRKQLGEDLIKRYFKLIGEADAILVLNLEKNGIKNYIGGNTLIEMAFAHVLDKKIFLYNLIPEMAYTDEIKDMKPIVICGESGKIK